MKMLIAVSLFLEKSKSWAIHESHLQPMRDAMEAEVDALMQYKAKQDVHEMLSDVHLQMTLKGIGYRAFEEAIEVTRIERISLILDPFLAGSDELFNLASDCLTTWWRQEYIQRCEAILRGE